MAPMKSSEYFQPMHHRPLLDIRKYSLITDQKSEFYAVVKPSGLDVYVANGVMYDFYHNPIQNIDLNFSFEKLKLTSINLKALVLGVLVSPNDSFDILKYKASLFLKSRSTFTKVHFIVYDIIFPVFNVDHDYKMRYDIADKTIGVLPNCVTATKIDIKNGDDLLTQTNMLFSIDTAASLLVYRTDGMFIPGVSQLYYDDHDTVSYIVEAKQKFRAHIKKVVSTTLVLEDGNKIEVAMLIVAKFKKDFVEIPISRYNLGVRRFIWENRKNLKEHPFWFTGYTLLDKGEYVTVINEFLSFIPEDK